jgi:hypothetical protein
MLHYVQTSRLLQSNGSSNSSDEAKGRSSNSGSRATSVSRNAASTAAATTAAAIRSSCGCGSSSSSAFRGLGHSSIVGTGSNRRDGLLLGDAGEDGGNRGRASDGGVDADSDRAQALCGSHGGGARTGGGGESLASLRSSLLGLDEVLDLAGFGQAGSDNGLELLLEAGLALAGSVVELAAGLGNVLLKTFESTLRLTTEVLSGDNAGGSEEENSLHFA